jgi:hypothetical protein
MTTTIQVTREIRDWIAEFGMAGDSLNDALENIKSIMEERTPYVALFDNGQRGGEVFYEESPRRALAKAIKFARENWTDDMESVVISIEKDGETLLAKEIYA